MRYFCGPLLLVLLLSCDKRKADVAFPEFMTHLNASVHAYHSTNILVAEQGLLSYRSWLLERLSVDKTNAPGYYPSLYRTDARLFQIYEFKGETNQAHVYFVEAVEARKHSRQGGDFDNSKEALREEIAREERGENLGWKAVRDRPQD